MLKYPTATLQTRCRGATARARGAACLSRGKLEQRYEINLQFQTRKDKTAPRRRICGREERTARPRHGTMICQAVFHSGRCRDKARGRTKCGSSRSIGATFRFPIRPIDRYFGPVVRRALRRYNFLFILRRRNANEGSDRNLQAGENHGHADAGPRIGRIQIYSRTEPFAARNKRFVL